MSLVVNSAAYWVRAFLPRGTSYGDRSLFSLVIGYQARCCAGRFCSNQRPPLIWWSPSFHSTVEITPGRLMRYSVVRTALPVPPISATMLARVPALVAEPPTTSCG